MKTQTQLKSADAAVGEKSRALHAIWKSTLGSRMAPKREEITLGMVRNLSPWLWVIDVVDGGADFRFRLTGDRIVQFFGHTFTGVLLSELHESPFFQRMRHTLTHCVEHQAPVAIGPIAAGYEDKNYWEMEAVVLPLSEDGKIVNCLMGAMELWQAGTNGAQQDAAPAISSI